MTTAVGPEGDGSPYRVERNDNGYAVRRGNACDAAEQCESDPRCPFYAQSTACQEVYEPEPDDTADEHEYDHELLRNEAGE